MATIDNQKISKEFGAFIRKGRESQGVRQEDVANQVDICRSYYAHIEAGQRQAYFALAVNICRVLNLDISSFLKNLE